MKKKILSEAEMSRRKKINKRTLIFLGIPALVLWIFVLSLDSSESSVHKKEDLNAAAYIVSQEFVKTQLKYPHTADFPFLDFKYYTQDSIIYVISTHFTSENKLGLKVNSAFQTKLKYKGGESSNPNSWELVDMKIE